MEKYQGKAAIARESNKPWSIEEVEFDSPQAGEVLVRIVATGMCHTDVVCRDGFPVEMPLIMGHEGSGVVEAVGEGVSRVKKGDHVVLSFNSCGQCRNCNDDSPAYCFEFFQRNFGGKREQDGSSSVNQNGEAINANFFGQSSFATYAMAHEVNVVPVDADLPLEILGPLGCGIQTGAGSVVNSLGAKAGDSLVIFGGGAVGLSGLMAAKANDVGPVVVVEPNAERRNLATELGADHVIDPIAAGDGILELLTETLGGGANLAMDTTGIPAVISVASEVLLPKGQLGLLGVPPAETNMPINMLSALLRGIRIYQITEGDAEPQKFIPEMIKWYKAGKFPFDKLITRFSFDQINEAADASLNGAAIKPVLIMND